MICPKCGDECEHMVEYGKHVIEEWEYCWNCDAEYEADTYEADYTPRKSSFTYDEIYGEQFAKNTIP